jgi:hypothetical protein
MSGRDMPLCLSPHGAEQGGARPSPRGQDGGAPQDQQASRRRGRKGRPKHGQYRRGTRWDVPGGGPAVGLTPASRPRVLAAIAPQQIRVPHPLNLVRGAKAQKSSYSGFVDNTTVPRESIEPVSLTQRPGLSKNLQVLPLEYCPFLVPVPTCLALRLDFDVVRMSALHHPRSHPSVILIQCFLIEILCGPHMNKSQPYD